ncbi:MAG: amidohydrolase family protein [Algicola sp.]|nr:amidohydrolase family protein [Algicola sp.]
MKAFLKYFIMSLVSIAAVIAVVYQYDLYVWQQPQKQMWIVNGLLFDGTSDKAIKNPGIVIKDGKIACLGSHCEIPQDTVTIDASGKAIVPGLIDLHGHFFAGKSKQPGQSLPSVIWEQFRFLPDVRRKLIKAGITSYRSLGDVAPAIFDLKQKLSEQDLAGPRLFISGPIFTVKGGHPTQKKGIPKWVIDLITVQSNDAEYVKQQVTALVKQGIDGVKVVYQSHTNEQGVVTMPRMSKKTLQAITDEARKHGLWIAVHTGTPAETVEAISAGITTIEHGVRHGNLIQSKVMQQIVSSDIVYVPTLGREPKGHLNISALSQAGVMLGVGTDMPVETADGYSYHNELSRMVNAGLTDVKALIAATRNGAQALGKLDVLGTIEEQKYADLLIIDGLPWQDISDLKNIELVILSGRIAFDKRAND